jgi:hypothetical protein
MEENKARETELNELKVTKPVSVWNREIDISTKDLLKGVAKAVLKASSLDFAGAGEAVVDTIDTSGFKNKPGELAWLLIHRALISAIANLTHNYSDLFGREPDEHELESISGQFEKAMEELELTISSDFFDKPAELSLLQDIILPLENWMKGLGVSEDNAKNICQNLPEYFVTALHKKWRDAPQDYVSLREFFDTPFTQATEKIREWQLYYQWLKSQVSDRMFSESFGVEKVYIPLRAYFEQKKDEKEKNSDSQERLRDREDETENVVCDLEQDFKDWLNNFPAGPAVRFISGGPGSGKSTFSKIFAGKIAKETKIPVLYIPLHLFDATENLVSAMESYIKGNRFLSGNPLDAQKGEERLFIIFDGLDELALQGKVASEVAKEFVNEVANRTQQGNAQGLKRQVLITGRTIAVQSVADRLREDKQICYVLPYLINDEDEFIDPEKLLGKDQRELWWELYGQASGKNYAGMPRELKRKSLEEITAQPLLNYLVALSFDRKQIEFTDDTTLNQIYSDMIKQVYNRQYEEGRISAYVESLKEDQFIRVLEEIALAIWHGDGRTTTVKTIQNKCEIGGINRYLEAFQEGAKAGVTRLLTAFYFRKSENVKDGDPTFEFTHKSFGEYLTALRIKRLLQQVLIQTKRRQENIDDGWEEKEALEKWVSVFHVTAVDEYLMKFVSNELRDFTSDDLTDLQEIIRKLLTYTINQGLPFPSDFEKTGFKQLLKAARNAEEALLAIHYPIAKITSKVSRLDLKSDTDFGEWISRLRGQRKSGLGNCYALQSLGFLDLSAYNLYLQDFVGANFERANFENTLLGGADFWTANFKGASLEGAYLWGANITMANLGRANLNRAHLEEADLEGTYLEEAHFEEAFLERANLKSTILEGAELEGGRVPKHILEKIFPDLSNIPEE